MTAAQEAKAHGFKDLNQVAATFSCCTQHLRDLHKKQHDKFLIVLHGCLWALNKETESK